MSIFNSTTHTQIINITQRAISESELKELELNNIVHFYVSDILGSIVFTLGIVFNVLSFTYFQLSRSFRDTSMRHYFSVLSITDSIRLSEWLFSFFLDKKLFTLNRTLCSIFLFGTISSGHISIWLLVFLSIERYIILQFPFRGKQFYTQRNSMRVLLLVIVVIVLADIPYLLPNFVEQAFINYDIHLHMCITNAEYRSYMFINNVLFYSLIPFCILLAFNCLLISLLAKQKTQLLNVTQIDNKALNAKREKQFKERTILLMIVTFFLVMTVSPRFIIQMVFVLTRNQRLIKVTISKCLIILEMLNFSFNFFFYIICSKTSRNELYLILYYFFYWKWSANSKKYIICNHANHNPNYTFASIQSHRPSQLYYLNGQSSASQNGQAAPSANLLASVTNPQNQLYIPPSSVNNSNAYEATFSMFKMNQTKTRLKIHCFLINAARLRNMQQSRRASTNCAIGIGESSAINSNALNSQAQKSNKNQNSDSNQHKQRQHESLSVNSTLERTVNSSERTSSIKIVAYGRSNKSMSTNSAADSDVNNITANENTNDSKKNVKQYSLESRLKNLPTNVCSVYICHQLLLDDKMDPNEATPSSEQCVASRKNSIQSSSNWSRGARPSMV
jgi:hypothetical protein